MDDRFFKNTEMIREILAGVGVTVEEALQNFDANMEALNRLAAPEPELIQGYTSEQWEGIIDGGYLCEFWCLGGPKKFGILAVMNGNTNYRFGEGGSKWWSNCRPAQIKGVMRPIFVEPVDSLGLFHFFDRDGGFLGHRLPWDGITYDATKYIEL